MICPKCLSGTEEFTRDGWVLVNYEWVPCPNCNPEGEHR